METLPDEILSAEILVWCAEYAPALRAVCRAWRDFALTLPARATRKKGLSFLAKNGHAELAVWVREQRGDFMQPQLNKMLEAACHSSDTRLARLLHGWGAVVTDEALMIAVQGGRAGLVFL